MFAAAASLAVGCRPPDDARSAKRVQEAVEAFARVLEDEATGTGLGSVSAAVMMQGEMIFERAFGWADREHRIAAEPSTVYRIGSITKTITAAVMMQMVEDGLIALDEPIERSWPAIQALRDYRSYAQITWRQLASHSAGLVREPDLEGADAGPLAAWVERLRAALPTTGFLGSPGEQYAYSNIGYGILGLALSEIADRPFPELVAERLFRPAGMASSAFSADRIRNRLAVGYGNWDPSAEVDVGLPQVEHEGRGYKVPNGGAYATAADLLRFASELSARPRVGLLDASSRREMTRIHSPLGVGEVYGLGLILTTGRSGAREETLAWHDGQVAGYSAMLVTHPPTATAVVWLRNYNRGTVDLDRAIGRLLTVLVPLAGDAVR